MVEILLIISGLVVIFITLGIKRTAIIISVLVIIYYFFGFKILLVNFLFIMLFTIIRLFIRIENAEKG
jgi:hypothetical protein